MQQDYQYQAQQAYPHRGSLGEDAATRIPEVTNELARMDGAAKRLNDTALQLAERLKPVMRGTSPINKQETVASTLSVPLSTPTGIAISNLRGAVDGTEQLLSDLLARLEV